MTESAATFETTASVAVSNPRLSDEAANFLTHATGFALSLIATAHLVTCATQYGDAWQIAGCCIYGATLVALYAASTLSHSFSDGEWRTFFRMLDQICIFLLIAGSYTPFGLTFLREGWAWWILVGMWALAITGIAFKVCYRRASNVSTPVFLMMGWLPLIGVQQIITHFPSGALAWIALGGMAYTIGTVFLTLDCRYRYFHAVWHILVMIGSACHFVGVINHVVPAIA